MHGDGEDHAEGIALLEGTDEQGHPQLLVLASPAADRQVPGGGMLADVLDLPR